MRHLLPVRPISPCPVAHSFSCKSLKDPYGLPFPCPLSNPRECSKNAAHSMKFARIIRVQLRNHRPAHHTFNHFRRVRDSSILLNSAGYADPSSLGTNTINVAAKGAITALHACAAERLVRTPPPSFCKTFDDFDIHSAAPRSFSVCSILISQRSPRNHTAPQRPLSPSTTALPAGLSSPDRESIVEFHLFSDELDLHGATDNLPPSSLYPADNYHAPPLPAPRRSPPPAARQRVYPPSPSAPAFFASPLTDHPILLASFRDCPHHRIR